MTAPHGPPLDPRVGAVATRVGAGLALLAATLYVLRPFIVPVIWATILAYVTWPLYGAVSRRTKRPRLAAGLFTAVVTLGAGIPVAWLLVALAGEATQLIGALRGWLDAGAPLPDWVMSRPWLATRVTEARDNAIVDPTAVIQYVTRYASQVSSRLVDVASGLATNVLKFALTVLSLFFFYLDGEGLGAQLGRLARIMFPSAPRMLDHVGSVVRAVVFGLIGTALVQGVVAGIGFALFSVPSPIALGAITFVGSFIPAGPTLIWLGAAAWLLVGGSPGAALGMALYGFLFISSIDNVLRPLLISGGEVPIHFLIVFFGVLGGLASFGMLGLFLGPVLLSVTFALIVDFSRRGEPDPAPGGA
jgi:predicted PurR-regulated permease PerM